MLIASSAAADSAVIAKAEPREIQLASISAFASEYESPS
jgi:hypothetical protein